MNYAFIKKITIRMYYYVNKIRQNNSFINAAFANLLLVIIIGLFLKQIYHYKTKQKKNEKLIDTFNKH